MKADRDVRRAVVSDNFGWSRARCKSIYADGRCLDLAPWQSGVIPAGTVHRTRDIGRTVNVTFERHGAPTVFADSGREGERSAGVGST